VLENDKKINWTHSLRNKEVLHRVTERRNNLQQQLTTTTNKKRKVNFIGHILRRNCLKTRYRTKYIRKDRNDGKKEEVFTG
jgi:hypothetical protein